MKEIEPKDDLFIYKIGTAIGALIGFILAFVASYISDKNQTFEEIDDVQS